MPENQYPQGYLSQEDYESIYRKVPMFCVDMLAKVDGGILLSRRNIEPFKGFWHFPGGRVRYKEPVEEALKRIAKAEIGIDTTNLKAQPIDVIDALNDGEFRHSISVVYGLDLDNFDLNHADFQSSELKVFKTIPQEMQPYQEYFLKTHIEEAFGKNGGFA